MLEKATLGGGCFWCTEAIFKRLRGVEKVIPGYAGGHTFNPTYEEVCTGTTGHAEVVQITFNPEIIDYETLLRVFFATHDPTTPNQQGNDYGPQYRSIILYHNENQRRVAEKVMEELAKEFDKPIVTEVKPLEAFFPAEEYHHNYFERNPTKPYCQVVIAPKVEKFVKNFHHLLKPSE